MPGPLLISLAAALWALDALLRTELTRTIPAAWIVTIEHAVGFLLLSPFFIRSLPRLKRLTGRDWVIVVSLTIVSSVAGTLLFTEALAKSGATFDFATPVLLQKMQPLFVALLAALFLKERLTRRYLLLLPVALVGSYLISFGAILVPFAPTGKVLVYLLAIGSALAWGSGTILSKLLLQKLSYADATALRFLLAIPIGFVIARMLSPNYSVMSLGSGEIIRFIIIGLSTGAGAILIYYRGLAQTEAKVSTIAELSFPIVSIAIAITSLNPYGAPQQLSFANCLGIGLLLFAIVAVSFERRSA